MIGDAYPQDETSQGRGKNEPAHQPHQHRGDGDKIGTRQNHPVPLPQPSPSRSEQQPGNQSLGPATLDRDGRADPGTFRKFRTAQDDYQGRTRNEHGGINRILCQLPYPQAHSMKNQGKQGHRDTSRKPFGRLNAPINLLGERPWGSHRNHNGPWKIQSDGYPLTCINQRHFAGYPGHENSGF